MTPFQFGQFIKRAIDENGLTDSEEPIDFDTWNNKAFNNARESDQKFQRNVRLFGRATAEDIYRTQQSTQQASNKIPGVGTRSGTISRGNFVPPAPPSAPSVPQSPKAPTPKTTINPNAQAMLGNGATYNNDSGFTPSLSTAPPPPSPTSTQTFINPDAASLLAD